MAGSRRVAVVTAIAVTVLVVVFGFAAPASAGTLTWSGTLAPGDPTWDRPTCAGLSGDVEFYDQQAFNVTVAGSYSITMPTMTGSVSPDGYFLLYSGSFNPAAPNTNCIAEDDDSGSGLAPALTVSLVADTTYILVTTQCCDGTTAEEGIAYTNDVTGPGEVILGPFVPPTTTFSTSTTSTTTTISTTTTSAATTTSSGATTTSSGATTTVAASTTSLGAGAIPATGGTVGPSALVGAVFVAAGAGTLIALRRRSAPRTTP